MNTEAIREIQQALRLLSFREPSIPRVVIDGQYSHDTKRAVSVFQQLYGLPISGETDPVTWDRLTEAARDASVLTPSPLYVFPHEQFRIRIGEQHDSIPVIKHILNTLSLRYNNLPQVGYGRVYDEATSEAVRTLRSLHDLESNDEIDAALWELLVLLYNRTTYGGSDSA